MKSLILNPILLEMISEMQEQTFTAILQKYCNAILQYFFWYCIGIAIHFQNMQYCICNIAIFFQYCTKYCNTFCNIFFRLMANICSCNSRLKMDLKQNWLLWDHESHRILLKKFDPTKFSFDFQNTKMFDSKQKFKNI